MLACICQSSRSRNIRKNFDTFQRPFPRPKFSDSSENEDDDLDHVETVQPSRELGDGTNGFSHAEYSEDDDLQDRENEISNMTNSETPSKSERSQMEPEVVLIIDGENDADENGSHVKYAKLKMINGRITEKNCFYTRTDAENKNDKYGINENERTGNNGFLDSVKRCLENYSFPVNNDNIITVCRNVNGSSNNRIINNSSKIQLLYIRNNKKNIKKCSISGDYEADCSDAGQQSPVPSPNPLTQTSRCGSPLPGGNPPPEGNEDGTWPPWPPEGGHSLQHNLSGDSKIPDGGDLTVSELREMATRQQQQIESQQQLLVAREQRLKYLKQQEGRSAQVTMEAERFRRLRERVEAQETKLRRLRALRGQVDSSRLNAASLSSDLTAMRHLFSEKEKELVNAAAKVEELTRQLEEVRTGRGGGGGGATAVHNGAAMVLVGGSSNNLHIHQQELDKLRRELLYRNTINREAATRVTNQRDALRSRKEDIARIDKRIGELQQRLHRKRLLNQQLVSQISAATQAKQAQLQAVQQKARSEGKNETNSDPVRNEDHNQEDASQFGKHDPKYQTLPYNTKFSSGFVGSRGPQNSTLESDSNIYPPSSGLDALPDTPALGGIGSGNYLVNGGEGQFNANCSGGTNGVGVITRMAHSIPTHLPAKGHASALGIYRTLTHPSVGGYSASTVSSSLAHNSSTRVQFNGSSSRLVPQQIHSGNSETAPQNSQVFQPKLQQDEPGKVVLQPVVVAVTSSQDVRSSNLPPTSLSVSFSQKMSTAGNFVHGRSLSSLHQVQDSNSNKDIENVRAYGFPAGTYVTPHQQPSPQQVYQPSTSSTLPKPLIAPTSTVDEFSDGNDSKTKPTLPPKPIVPSKPTPPPRQKGDPMASSTESLSLSGVSPRSSAASRPQVFRYASQNVILSTYQQQSNQISIPISSATAAIRDATKSGSLKTPSSSVTTPSSNLSQLLQQTSADSNNLIQSEEKEDAASNNSKDSAPLAVKDGGPGGDEGPEKVHISINRRIEMPPDFLFPEDATPPSDLLGSPTKLPPESNLDTPDRSCHIDHFDDFDDFNVINNNTICNTNNNNNTLTTSINELILGKDSPSELTQTSIYSVEDATEEPEPENDMEFDEDIDEEGPIIISLSSANSVVRRLKKGNLKTSSSSRIPRRVSFDPLALLLDASLEGELELVKRTATEVPNPSAANDEGITALHNAICAGHLDIVTFLVTFGCDVNAQDSDGWTPLHCAASCNNLAMVRFLVEHGACVLATTLSDHETAAEKCEQDEEGYDGCSQYLYSVQEKLGIMNNSVVYAVYDYDSQNEDELTFKCGEVLTVTRRGDEYEREWWWVKDQENCGYVPRNLLGLYPRVKNPFKAS